MKAHIITLVIIDTDDVGGIAASEIVESAGLACADVREIITYDVGEWSDEHDLNQPTTDPLMWLHAREPVSTWGKV